MALSQNIKDQFFANALGIKNDDVEVEKAISEKIRLENKSHAIKIAKEIHELKDSGLSSDLVAWIITGKFEVK